MQGRANHLAQRTMWPSAEGFRMLAPWTWNCFCLQSALEKMNPPTILIHCGSMALIRYFVGKQQKFPSLFCSRTCWKTVVIQSCHALLCHRDALQPLLPGPTDYNAENVLVLVVCTSLVLWAIVPSWDKNKGREKWQHLQTRTVLHQERTWGV